ncbi:MAG: hypothetical protein ABIT38_04410 [Gemmatimonadaceae bacterium]
MSIRKTIAICATALGLAWIAACGGSKATTAPAPQGVDDLRASLGAFSSLALAKDAGYSAAITDCMSNGDVGAMGFHFGKPALIDGVVNPLTPEVLIYEPGTNGQMSLVGVEFIIPFAAVPKTAAAPVLFGQKFSPDDVFGLWALHVWTHRTNPSGLFAPWNPRVHCQTSRANNTSNHIGGRAMCRPPIQSLAISRRNFR